MSWEARTGGGNQGYFYRSVRRGDRIDKEYLGRGPEAEEAARQIEQRRQERQTVREALQKELAQRHVAEQQLHELQEVAYLLVRAVLTGAGYHRRRGEWRKKRHGGNANHDRAT